MGRGAGWRPSPAAIVSVIGGAAVCAAVLAGARTDQDAPPRAAQIPAQARPACQLEVGQTAAFRLRSTVAAEEAEDRFEATLSWVVESADQDAARVRAAFSDVRLSQDLAQPGERAASPEGAAFFFTVGRDCSLRAIGYPAAWDARTRLLVQTQMDNHAFALPPSPAPRWRTSGSDGLGPYTALFRVTARAPLTITRRKIAHAPRGMTAGLGIDLRVDRAVAVARFDRAQPQWWRLVHGQEAVTIEAEGSPAITLRQRFTLERDDARFASVPAGDGARADLQSPYTMALADAQAPSRFADSEQAWAAFRAAVAEGQEHDAAHALAAWLRAHPEDVAAVVAWLTTGAEPDTHAAIFLALELSDAPEARNALMGLIDDADLSGLDQARAALALASHGDPSQQVLDRLLQRADGGDMAARVSLLGAGALAGRSDDPALREGLVTRLTARLDAAEGEGDAHLALDAMGNSGDVTFLEALDGALSAESPRTRRHAAAALGRLPGVEAAPLLVERLRIEEAPRVAADLVQALAATGQRSPEALAVLQARLADAGVEERAAIISWLGEGGDPAAHEVLVAQFHREPSARLKQRIGRFLPATALR